MKILGIFQKIVTVFFSSP